MNWAETMKDNPTGASLENVASDEAISRVTQVASWDPFEVWLTRIKQPRDSAIKSAAAGVPNGVLVRRD
jgi:hypothetical protein